MIHTCLNFMFLAIVQSSRRYLLNLGSEVDAEISDLDLISQWRRK